MSYIEIDLDDYEDEIMTWLERNRKIESKQSQKILEDATAEELVEELKKRYNYSEAEKIECFFKEVDLFTANIDKIKNL